jgi:hypothetical protein
LNIPFPEPSGFSPDDRREGGSGQAARAGGGREASSHRTVKHSGGEYVRYEDIIVHTNTVENVFSVFKRGMKGVYQHCGEAHLHRYLAEFAFRYNNRSALNVSDAERAAKALKGIEGKRLTYRRAGEAANA